MDFHQIRHDGVCRKRRSLVIPVGISLVVKDFILRVKKTLEICIIDPFLFQNGCQPGQMIDLGNLQRIIIGHVLSIKRVLVWCDRKEKFFSSCCQILLHQRQRMGNVEKPSV